MKTELIDKIEKDLDKEKAKAFKEFLKNDIYDNLKDEDIDLLKAIYEHAFTHGSRALMNVQKKLTT